MLPFVFHVDWIAPPPTSGSFGSSEDGELKAAAAAASASAAAPTSASSAARPFISAPLGDVVKTTRTANRSIQAGSGAVINTGCRRRQDQLVRAGRVSRDFRQRPVVP